MGHPECERRQRKQRRGGRKRYHSLAVHHSGYVWAGLRHPIGRAAAQFNAVCPGDSESGNRKENVGDGKNRKLVEFLSTARPLSTYRLINRNSTIRAGCSVHIQRGWRECPAVANHPLVP